MGVSRQLLNAALLLVAAGIAIGCATREQLTSIQPARAVVPAHDDAVWSLALSKDGLLLASGGGSGEVKLWESSTLGLKATLPGPGGAVAGLAWSPDGKQIAGGTLTGRIEVWDVSTGQGRVFEPAQNGSIRGIGFSADGGTLVSVTYSVSSFTAGYGAAGEIQVTLWDIASGKEQSTSKKPAFGMASVSPAGKLVAFGANTHRLNWFDVSGSSRWEAQGITLFPGDEVVFSPDGRYLAALYIGKSGSNSMILDLENPGNPGVAVLKAAPFQPTCGAVSHRREMFARSIAGDGIKIWKISTGEALAAVRESDGLVSGISTQMKCLLFSLDDETIITGSSDGTLKLWDVRRLLTP